MWGGGGGHLFIYLFLMLSAPKLGYRTGFQSTSDSLSFCERSDPRKRLIRGGANGFKTRRCALICERYWTLSRRPRRESPGTQGDSRFDRFRCLSASFLLISSRRRNRPSSTEVPLAQTQHTSAISKRARKHLSAFFSPDRT